MAEQAIKPAFYDSCTDPPDDKIWGCVSPQPHQVDRQSLSIVCHLSPPNHSGLGDLHLMGSSYRISTQPASQASGLHFDLLVSQLAFSNFLQFKQNSPTYRVLPDLLLLEVIIDWP